MRDGVHGFVESPLVVRCRVAVGLAIGNGEDAGRGGALQRRPKFGRLGHTIAKNDFDHIVGIGVEAGYIGALEHVHKSEQAARHRHEGGAAQGGLVVAAENGRTGCSVGVAAKGADGVGAVDNALQG